MGYSINRFLAYLREAGLLDSLPQQQIYQPLLHGYLEWMRHYQHAADGTLQVRSQSLTQFLQWLGPEAAPDGLSRLTAQRIEAFFLRYAQRMGRSARRSMQSALRTTLARRLPQEMHWLTNQLRGGLVFTHPKVSLEIDPSCRVEYGSISDWVKRISTSPAVPNMTTEVILCLVDALHEYAREISTENGNRSAEQLAVDLYQRAEYEIPTFVKANL